MCQCVICDCIWGNLCGVVCGGCFMGWLCASCWLAMPDEMIQIDPLCCKVGCPSGWGYNYCCYGLICCIPDSIKTYSGVVTMGANVINVNGGNTQTPMNNQGYY